MSSVAGVGRSCSSGFTPKGDLLCVDRGDVGLGPAAAWVSAPGLVLCAGLPPSWAQWCPLTTGPLLLPCPPVERGSTRLQGVTGVPGNPYSCIAFSDFVGCSTSASVQPQFSPPRLCWLVPPSLESEERLLRPPPLTPPHRLCSCRRALITSLESDMRFIIKVMRGRERFNKRAAMPRIIHRK